MMKAWKAPNRPAHEISQPFTDGIVNIYDIKDVAQPGRKPEISLKEIYSLEYENRKLGIQRYFSGKQNQIEISRVIRIPAPPTEITNQQIAVTEKGTQYRIRMVQSVKEAYPESYDLTLERIAQNEEYPL